MDAHQHHEKDFLSSMFPADEQQRPQINMYSMPYTQSTMPPSMPQNVNPQLSMDMLNNLMSMQGIESQPTSPTSPHYNPQTLLEQQFKLTQLQQLQQLQNQILQQQIALISSQTAGILQNTPPVEPQRDPPPNQFNGLPTPGPSAEIPPQQTPMEYVSPMVLNNSYLDTPEPYRPDHHMTPMHNHTVHSNYTAPRGSTSAPEHIAFRTSLPSPADLDFDISPLTSPWLGAHPHQQAMSHFSSSSSNKRNASSSGDEGNGMQQPSRKRQSPAIRPTNPDHGVPPAAPAPPTLPPAASSSSSSLSSEQVQASPQFNPHLTPVTPASIMNLGRLGINNDSGNGGAMAPPPRPVVTLKTEAKGKAAATASTSATKPKAAETPRSRTTRKAAAAGSLISPSLKAILPAGSGPHPMPLSSPALLPTTPGVQVRKTSHKAAEQKRRDSLKTTFDDLRVLLPPSPYQQTKSSRRGYSPRCFAA
ncbi:hypothetical protein LshimejAT787_1100420 [Lyophyllum shimeji]|uniref:BHLH domain-containing protein n=1 Tax=Lyophyllum shimeji TaxID=47721 RepID=A0A9P3URA5_LYOSH|nr:hypothetical protein LshimejAT787_1100420 [Lyophyllum shimeji]